MPWIGKKGSLTFEESTNNANIVINYYRSVGFPDTTIAGIMGNMYAESGINPNREETGGTGYGLVQWTPVSVLQNACTVLGLSPYTSGDIQLQVISQEVLNYPNIAQWYTSEAFISRFYNSGATPDMIGITGQQFLSNEMNWTPSKLAILFMAGYERPSYDPEVNHWQLRQQWADYWFEYMGGVIPPEPIAPIKRKTTPIFLFLMNRRLR